LAGFENVGFCHLIGFHCLDGPGFRKRTVQIKKNPDFKNLKAALHGIAINTYPWILVSVTPGNLSQMFVMRL